MKPCLRLFSLVSLTIALTACATAPDQTVTAASNRAEECVQVTGSGICRRSNSGTVSPTESISGEELRKGTGAVTGAQPGHIGN